MGEAEQQFEDFLARYEPAIAAIGRDATARLRALLPAATCLIYDNYNALVAAFSTSGRPSNAILSIALYPRWVTLFLAAGASFEDPHGLLKGKGGVMRHIVLASAADIDRPEIGAMIAQALKMARVPLDHNRCGELIIQSVAAKQRPRRP